MYIEGHIHSIENGVLKIIAPFDRPFDVFKKQITSCEIRLDDGRTISGEQRKKIYATLRDIAEHTGYTVEDCKQIMKCKFYEVTGTKEFSLSDTDMSTAYEFQEFLIEFCLDWNIPLSDEGLNRCADVSRFIYKCLVTKKCCICGKKADLHHVEAVGAGRDRDHINHMGLLSLPLCREHHTESHKIGQESFIEKYHLTPIRIDEEITKIYKLGVNSNVKFDNTTGKIDIRPGSKSNK